MPLVFSYTNKWSDMAADQQVRCIDAIYWKAKEVVDIFRISRFQEPSFFVDSPLDSGHKTPLDEMFCIGPHYGSRYWDCNVNELKYYHNKNLIMAHVSLKALDNFDQSAYKSTRD